MASAGDVPVPVAAAVRGDDKAAAAEDDGWWHLVCDPGTVAVHRFIYDPAQVQAFCEWALGDLDEPWTAVSSCDDRVKMLTLVAPRAYAIGAALTQCFPQSAAAEAASADGESAGDDAADWANRSDSYVLTMQRSVVRHADAAEFLMLVRRFECAKGAYVLQPRTTLDVEPVVPDDSLMSVCLYLNTGSLVEAWERTQSDVARNFRRLATVPSRAGGSLPLKHLDSVLKAHATQSSHENWPDRFAVLLVESKDAKVMSTLRGLFGVGGGPLRRHVTHVIESRRGYHLVFNARTLGQHKEALPTIRRVVSALAASPAAVAAKALVAFRYGTRALVPVPGTLDGGFPTRALTDLDGKVFLPPLARQ